MANTIIGSAPTVPQRRRKTAKERREQKSRAFARAFQTVAAALENVQRHRGGSLRDIGTRWHSLILRPHASEVPIPDFTKSQTKVDLIRRAHSNVALQSSQHDDASYQASGDCGIEQLLSLQESVSDNRDDDEQLSSQEDDQESEEVASRSSSDSGRAHGNVALPQESAESDDDTDEDVDNLLDSEDAEADKAVVESDPEQQRFYRRIHVPEVLRQGESVGSNRALSCKFSIGDLIRPIQCLANLDAYKKGSVCQVVALEDGSIRPGLDDPIVSYFNDKGDIRDGWRMVIAEHFEKIGTIAVFDDWPYTLRCALLRNRGALIIRSTQNPFVWAPSV